MSHINLFPFFGYLSIYLPLSESPLEILLPLTESPLEISCTCLIQDRFAILAKQNGFTGLERVGERLSDECSLESVICGCRRSYDKIRALVMELSVRREECYSRKSSKIQSTNAFASWMKASPYLSI